MNPTGLESLIVCVQNNPIELFFGAAMLIFLTAVSIVAYEQSKIE